MGLILIESPLLDHGSYPCRYTWEREPDNAYTRISVGVTKRLKYRPNAPSGVVVYDDGTILLRSHQWNVLAINPNGYIEFYSCQSRIVAPNVSAFLKEYAPSVKYSQIRSMVTAGGRYWIPVHEPTHT